MGGDIFYYYLPYMDTGFGARPLVVSYDGVLGMVETWKQVDITGLGLYVWVPESSVVNLEDVGAVALRKEIRGSEVFFTDLSTGREFWYDQDRRGIVMAEWYEVAVQTGAQLASQALGLASGVAGLSGKHADDLENFKDQMVSNLLPHAMETGAPTFAYWFGHMWGVDSVGQIISLADNLPSIVGSEDLVQAYANEVGRADLYTGNLTSATGYRGGEFVIYMGSGQFTGKQLAQVIGDGAGTWQAVPRIYTDYTESGEAPAQAGMVGAALPWVLAGGAVLLLYTMGRRGK